MTTVERKPIVTYKGVVTSRSGDKAIRVNLNYLFKHKKYGKILKRRTVAHVHDENNQAQVGDMVEVCKCRPLSKTKSWRLLRVVGENAELT